MNDDQKEALLSQAMEDLKTKASEAINDALSTLYTDYLPHVLCDTESNLGLRVDGVLQNIIEGNYKKTEYGTIIVEDGRGFTHSLQVAQWYSSAAKALTDQMGEEIKDARIKQLEKEIDLLRANMRRGY